MYTTKVTEDTTVLEAQDFVSMYRYFTIVCSIVCFLYFISMKPPRNHLPPAQV
ncbi:hypothetical protein F5878DRAFT_569554, partial [Lentinula raphanica]